MKKIILSPGPVLLVWLGIVIGISFIEGPVKFTTPTLTREVALDVGRVVFTALNRTELILLALTLLLGYISERRRTFWLGASALVAMLTLQTLWLLPELTERALIIVAGGDPAPSIAHATYAGIEVAKALLLAVLGLHALRGTSARSG